MASEGGIGIVTMRPALEGVSSRRRTRGRSGNPTNHYPESYMRLLAFVRLLFHQPYRHTEGFVHFLSRFVEGLQVSDYFTIVRRVNRLHVDLDESLIKSNRPDPMT